MFGGTILNLISTSSKQLTLSTVHHYFFKNHVNIHQNHPEDHPPNHLNNINVSIIGSYSQLNFATMLQVLHPVAAWFVRIFCRCVLNTLANEAFSFFTFMKKGLGLSDNMEWVWNSRKWKDPTIQPESERGMKAGEVLSTWWKRNLPWTSNDCNVSQKTPDCLGSNMQLVISY